MLKIISITIAIFFLAGLPVIDQKFCYYVIDILIPLPAAKLQRLLWKTKARVRENIQVAGAFLFFSLSKLWILYIKSLTDLECLKYFLD